MRGKNQMTLPQTIAPRLARLPLPLRCNRARRAPLVARARTTNGRGSSTSNADSTRSSTSSADSTTNTTSGAPAAASWIVSAYHAGTLHPPSAVLTGLTGFAAIAAGIQSPADQAQAAEPAATLTTTLQAAAADMASLQPPPPLQPLQPASLLLALDQALHESVVGGTSPGFRAFWGGLVASDSFIILGIIGWCLLSSACLLRAPRQAAAPIGLAWAFYFSTAGAVGYNDPPLVYALKQLFGRVRPSSLMHHTFSFPSGHTSAAVFIVGGLLTVLLPLTLQLFLQQEGRGGSSSDGSSSSSSSSDSSASSSSWDNPAFIYALWGMAGLTTAAGRVLADAHWLSDTLAACCLSVGLVAVMGNAVRPLMPPPPPRRAQQ